MGADPVADLFPPAGQELLLGAGGDPAAARRSGDARYRVAVGVDQDEAGDQVGMPGGQDDGHRAAHALRDQLRPGDARGGEQRGERVGERVGV